MCSSLGHSLSQGRGFSTSPHLPSKSGMQKPYYYTKVACLNTFLQGFSALTTNFHNFVSIEGRVVGNETTRTFKVNGK